MTKKCGYITLLKCCCTVSVGLASGVTAQDLQTQGNVVDPAQWVDAQVAAEDWWFEIIEGFLIIIIVSLEDLRKQRSRIRVDFIK